MLHLAGCDAGSPDENSFDHLIIVGPDMHVDQWMSVLQREELADGPKLSDKVWHSGTQILLVIMGFLCAGRNANGIQTVDLSSSINSLNLDEKESRLP